MKNVLIVGSGDVARRAIPWLAKRFRVYALTRRPEEMPTLRATGAIPLLADLDDRKSLRKVSGIAHSVLHFAPPPGRGDTDTRTSKLLAALASRQSLPQRLVYISTTGVYGDRAGAWVSETTTCNATTARAKRRVDAETRLRVFGRRNHCAVSILRAPGIYAADRLPLARLERGDPVLLPEEDVHTNHIHAEDLARMACLALFRAGSGRVYNAVDQTDLTMGDFFDLAADLFDRPRPERVSREALASRVSPMALSFMSESRRIDGARIRNEFRIALSYPTVREGFAAALAQAPADPGPDT